MQLQNVQNMSSQPTKIDTRRNSNNQKQAAQNKNPKSKRCTKECAYCRKVIEKKNYFANQQQNESEKNINHQIQDKQLKNNKSKTNGTKTSGNRKRWKLPNKFNIRIYRNRYKIQHKFQKIVR